MSEIHRSDACRALWRPVVALLLLATAVEGCQTTVDDAYEKLEENYNRTPAQKFEAKFTEMFGNVSSDITWQTATYDSLYVRVNTPEPTLYAQLFTASPFGDRPDCFLLQEKTISTNVDSVLFCFDMPEGLKYIYLALTSEDGSRTVYPLELGHYHSLRVKTMSTAEATGTLLTPESTSSYYPFRTKYYSFSSSDYSFYANNFNRANGLLRSFEYMSTGNDIYLIPFGNSTESDRTLYYYPYNPLTTDLGIIKSGLEAGTLTGVRLYESDAVQVSVGMTGQYNTKPYIIRSLPAGCRVFFYTEQPNGRLYSVAEMNEGMIAGGALSGNGHTYVRFDAMGSNATLRDVTTRGIEDFALCVYGGMLVDREGSGTVRDMGYSLALEAPVDTSRIDMDYNDAVVRIHHVADKDVIHVVPVAVGENVPVSLSYKGEELWEDLHSAFQTTSNVFVNTSDSTMLYRFDTITIAVPADFSIVEGAKDFTFGFSTVLSSGVKSYSYGLVPEANQNPHVLLLASPRWSWPFEGTAINEAYQRMSRWVTTPSAYPLWYSPTWTSLNSWTELLPEVGGDRQL